MQADLPDIFFNARGRWCEFEYCVIKLSRGFWGHFRKFWIGLIYNKFLIRQIHEYRKLKNLQIAITRSFFVVAPRCLHRRVQGKMRIIWRHYHMCGRHRWRSGTRISYSIRPPLPPSNLPSLRLSSMVPIITWDRRPSDLLVLFFFIFSLVCHATL